MNMKTSQDILVGRPFGGVAVLRRKELSKYFTIIDKDDANDKFISFIINKYFDRSIVISCVYFPYYTLNAKQDYIVDASIIIAFIDNDLKHL